MNFQTGIDRLDEATRKEYEGRMDEVPGIFSLMLPKEEAVESFIELSKVFDTYILSTAPWENPSAWSDKLLWVKKYLGESAYKRLILTHHKNLNRGDFLVDDRDKNGALEFNGEFIHFGKGKFPDWKSVRAHLLNAK